MRWPDKEGNIHTTCSHTFHILVTPIDQRGSKWKLQPGSKYLLQRFDMLAASLEFPILKSSSFGAPGLWLLVLLFTILSNILHVLAIVTDITRHRRTYYLVKLTRDINILCLSSFLLPCVLDPSTYMWCGLASVNSDLGASCLLRAVRGELSGTILSQLKELNLHTH